jgi:50S ribosome-binding GTPase
VTLTDDVRELLQATIDVAGEEHVAILRDVSERLDAPLHLAIAGRVKAGKSTLLNALVGEGVAPTDAAECTKVVTWYVDGLIYRAWLHPRDGGDAIQIPFTREPGNASIDISGTPIDEIDRLSVEFPSQNLEGMNLIDTPGTASVSELVSERSSEFLLKTTSHVDVVIYLMRHLHDSDVDFLEAFAGEGNDIRPTMAIGVLSRADELGGGRSDAMEIAMHAADELASHPRLRTRVQAVVPVAGLLAFAAATLRENEFQMLRRLSRCSIDEIDATLAAADSFVKSSVIDDSTESDRRELAERLGMHGIRFGVAEILHGRVTSAQELAEALEVHSGLGRLRLLVRDLYAERRTVVKADLALSLIAEVARDAPREAARELEGGIERIRSTEHDFAELAALNLLRVDPPADLEGPRRVEAERLLGSHGSDTATRLGLTGALDVGDVRRWILELIQQWRGIGDRPLVSRELRTLVPVVLHTLERHYAALNDD